MAPWSDRVVTQHPADPAPAQSQSGARRPGAYAHASASTATTAVTATTTVGATGIPTFHATAHSRAQAPGRSRPSLISTAADRYRDASRAADFGVLDSWQIEVGSSSSDEGGLHPRRPPEPQRPRHTRSMSHPFPSFFSGKKKKKAGQMAGYGADDSGSGSVDEDDSPQSVRRRPSNRGHKTGASVGSKDYTTGHCMTCGSLMRWPKDIQVFKCTICLTINDLQPPGRSRRDDAGRSPARGQAPPSAPAEDGLGPNERPAAVSLDHTKRLVAECLRSYLSTALCERAGVPVPPPLDQPVIIPTQPSSWAEETSRRPLAVRHKASASTLFETQASPGEFGGQGLPPARPGPGTRSYSTSYPEGRPRLRETAVQARDGRHRSPQPPGYGGETRRIFRPLEAYLATCFTSFTCLNSSFLLRRAVQPSQHSQSRNGTENPRRTRPEPRREPRREPQSAECPITDVDAKLLLLGDVAENGAWWTGGQDDMSTPSRTASVRNQNGLSSVSRKDPNIDWAELEEWYTTVVDAAHLWFDVYESIVSSDTNLAVTASVLQQIEVQILADQEHVRRLLLESCETVLKRPGRPMSAPQDLRFLLIISANPLLHASYQPFAGEFAHPEGAVPTPDSAASGGSGPTSGRHSGIIKRIVGLLSNASTECHSHLVAWFARYPEMLFIQTKDLVAGFLTYRLLRQNEKGRQAKVDVTGGLIPNMGAGRSPASLHAALGHTRAGSSNRKNKEMPKKIVFKDDWQIKAAAQVLGFLFAANNMGRGRRNLTGRPHDGAAVSADGGPPRDRVQARGQILATSDFYTTLLDDADLVADFESWERKTARFSFCQFPFLLSIGAKIRVLEYDAKRQMENKARDAFFDSIMTHRVINQLLEINVRRDCLVEDSLKAVSEVIGSGGEDIKKGLKITFKGEEGVDAGGLRKEWFLLLVREVFNPDHGMFLYDEDSHYCYFNPCSLEPSEQFFLVGVVFGLAIYNSTILDVALPPFAFRKLLLAAPPASTGAGTSTSSPASSQQPRQAMSYTLDDLAEYRPRLAHGLRQLLEYDGGDVDSTFCLDFVVETNRYGAVDRVPLCPGGERRAVTNGNRKEYVDAYVKYMLDTAVTRQFEPFKRGFFTVCGGNALSLFRPEEIELLVRGSDETLDVQSLRAVAEYDGWTKGARPDGEEEVVEWFWDSFERAPPAKQRRLLLFITGSDRIPAMGAASLTIKIVCLGDDTGRYPSARTCFNVLALWRYETRERLERMLWTAVHESEGFGLK